VDGINLVTDKLFGRGSVPSKECYTPQPVSDEIRKSFDRGELSEGEYNFLKALFEFPLSRVPYRGAIPIAYVTTRKAWKFTRPIQPFLSVRTMLGGKKIVVIDDAHKMTAEAQNCILKTLEEPPADSVLILVTSDKRALFETIVSRCQVVSFGRLTREENDEAVRNLLGGERENMGLISALSENCPGRLLELALENIDERLENVKEFFSGVADGELAGSFRLSGAVMESAGRHRRKQRQTVTEALELISFWIAQVLRVGSGMPDTTGLPEYAEALKHHATSFERSALLRAAEHLEQSFDIVRWNVDMRLLLDTTLLRIARTLKESK
jgi:DNA polymerase-3 subunit delta'